MATKGQPRKASASKAKTLPATGKGRPFSWGHSDWFRERLDDYQAGNRWEPDQEVNDPNTYKLKDVHALFQSGGDLKTLGEMLRQRPALLWHPVVGDLIRYIAREWQRERQVSCNSPGDWELYNEQLKEPLKALVEAWVQGMLEGGYTIQPLPRRGRRLSEWEKDRRALVTHDYEDLLAFLQNDQELKNIITKGTTLKRKKLPFDSLKGPLAQVIRRIWEHPHHLHLFSDSTFDQKDPTPIPETLLTQVVKAALDQKDLTGSMRDVIAYHLLAHSHGLEKPGSVKRMVVEYRKSAGLTRRRKPTSKSRSTSSR